MSTRKKAGMPVVKHKSIIIRKLGTRTGREFEAELAQAVAEGFKVYAFGKTYQGVEIRMGKDEEWDLGEFISEIRELLDEGSL